MAGAASDPRTPAQGVDDKRAKHFLARRLRHGWRSSAGLQFGLLPATCAWAADIGHDILLDTGGDAER